MGKVEIGIYFCVTADILCVFKFYGPVNNEVMSSQSVNSGTVPGQAYTF